LAEESKGARGTVYNALFMNPNEYQDVGKNKVSLAEDVCHRCLNLPYCSFPVGFSYGSKRLFEILPVTSL
jgi:hypothetical protein